ncbi:methylated-DNA--[protein]-cysteine S-methyltransferase [Flavobacterium aurantiibacter]|uniref:Methylated-DNA--protein-cysteine methyltransferase n=1 Tax=Flavobacterium aurantiibacter TaxID=2023067 RepID=A0A255ZR42_9FLAO|nr:methylated-DNA--[protein]-cysteine S-methyltransferase [Flavobacterium aurantiibacter]OYQ43891.1 hypothetical protein CHX27_08420 [Flavobacterium aurantiibacter]
MQHAAIYKAPWGNLYVQETNGHLQQIRTFSGTDSVSEPNSFLTAVFQQLDEYFAGKRQTFDLPLDLQGTEFQMQVWKLLKHIPYGKTLSYNQLATAYGNPKTIRAVAAANGANPILIVIPCHRVIGSNGQLVGYAGGMTAKKQLLLLEGALPPELF